MYNWQITLEIESTNKPYDLIYWADTIKAKWDYLATKFLEIVKISHIQNSQYSITFEDDLWTPISQEMFDIAYKLLKNWYAWELSKKKNDTV